MSKRPRSNLQGIMTPAQSHSRVPEQSPEQVVEQLHDADVPDVLPDPEQAEERPTSRSSARPSRAKTKAAEEPDAKDYAHRSLYAKPETLDLIRRIAFEERISAQALYREGLFLMLRKRGHYRDKSVDDV